MNLAVIGTGYVGLVAGTCFADTGNNVICVENNPEKLNKLQNKIVPIYEPGLENIFRKNIDKKRLHFTDDLESTVTQSEIVFLCLPTPQGEDGSADLSHIFNVADQIGEIMKKEGDTEFKIIVDKSTVPVGTAEKVNGLFNNHGLKNFEVVSNPEFQREGFAVEDFMKPDRVIIGTKSDKVMKKMKDLYEPFVRQGNPIIEMDPFSAEVTKYASNSYLAMRITFMNELANFCESVGADIDMVRKGMGTDTRIGKRFLFAGIGYGGSCFPKDVNALIKTSVESQSEMRLLKLVDQVNKEQKMVLVKKLLNHFEQDVKGKTFGIWGLSFKPNTDDMREAPAIVIIESLLELGANVKAYDPAANENAGSIFKEKIELCEDQYDVLENADALLILTEWNEFRNPDFDKIKELLKMPVIFDGRNVYDKETAYEQDFTYYSIGRVPKNI